VRRGQRPHFVFRTVLHIVGRFPPRDSGALVIYEGERVAHYSAFTPRYWRFPFLDGRDVQVGDTWTDPHYRGQGLAQRALHCLVALLFEPGRDIWYVVEEVNRASIKVAEICGFHRAGTGARVQRFKGLDYYQMVNEGERADVRGRPAS
jgi:RimJ/RimL family protein N-acetyltransferase